MLPKRTYIISGIVFLLIGFTVLLNSFQGLTGFVIIENVGIKLGYIIGVWFIVAGILMLTAGREKKEGELEIFISNKALERSKKDLFVRGNLNQYKNEIRMIASNPQARPQELVGEFHVSPSGQKSIRIAWHYDKANNKLYIDDFLYHKRRYEYNDKWNRKAANREVTKKDYENSGYREVEAL